MTKTYRIAAVPGDGIGKEVMPEGVRVLDAAARKFGFTLAFDHFDWNCDRLVKSGEWMPENWKDVVGGHHAIYFGATGWPAQVPDQLNHAPDWTGKCAAAQKDWRKIDLIFP